MSVILDLEGLELSQEEAEILRHPQVNGIILFTRNYQNPEQLKNLIQQIRAASKHYLLISVDHEGGRVQRFREGFSHLPALGEIGKRYDQSSAQALIYAEQMGYLMASELRAFDIDFSFAPVLDIDKGISKVIGNRAFHRDPQIIITLAKAYISGMRRAGMAAVGKHFPGHGSVSADSHIAIPIDTRTYQEIANEDLLPFKVLSTEDLEGIMPAHVIYSQVDKLPAGFSSFWLQEILRKQLNFQGAIFSDDLTMEGASAVGDLTERTRLALNAGCDTILVCNNRSAACQVVEYLERNTVSANQQSKARLEKFIGR